MKKKLLAVMLIVVMVLASTVMAFGQTAPEGATKDPAKGTITVSNPSKGETYKIYKLFDAELSDDYVAGNPQTGSMIYTGDIPTDLQTVFKKDLNAEGKVDAEHNGSIVLVSGASEFTATETAAIKAYVEANLTAVATAVSDGTQLEFVNLDFGYYVVTSTQSGVNGGTGVISIDTANKNGTVRDKNTTKPGVTKTIDDNDVFIGQKVYYTVEAETANYIEDADGDGKVQSYTIKDTLPDWLSEVDLTSVWVDDNKNGVKDAGEEVMTTDMETAFEGDAKQFVIPWVNAAGEHLHVNGAKIYIEYSAIVNAQAKLGGAIDENKTGTDNKEFSNRNGNINKVTLKPNKDKDGDEPYDDEYSDEAKFYSYAAALQKVDDNKKPLADAKFKFNGLTAEKVEDGVWRVTAYDPASTTPGTEMDCDAEGQLVLLGIDATTVVGGHDDLNSAARTLVGKETEAPAGYNLLAGDVTMTACKLSEEISKSTTKVYYDANGNVTSTETTVSYDKQTYNVDLLKTAIVVVNKKGVEMPGTGGIGTTILYTLGGILVVGAGVLLVARRKMER